MLRCIGFAVSCALVWLGTQSASADQCLTRFYGGGYSTPIYSQPMQVVSPATYSQAIPCPSPTTILPSQTFPSQPQQSFPMQQGYEIPKGLAPVPVFPQTKEPPLANKVNKVPPAVVESKSFSLSGEKQVVNAKDKCKVGFWNVSGKDVTVFINGHQHLVPRNQNITLTLDRQFSWHAGNGEPKNEVVQDGNEHEIVLR